MYKTIKKTVLLFLITLTAVCSAVFLSACGDSDGGDKQPEAKTATYSVTVVSALDEEIDFSTIKVQWMQGAEVVAEETLNHDGTAHAEIDTGVYTVALVGLPETATYTAVQVTATSSHATLHIRPVTDYND